MAGRDKKTVRDVIWFQYAKLIARKVYKLPDGHEAKKRCYGFITNLFLELEEGRKSWSDITAEDWRLADTEKKCAYCGGTDNLARGHLVPQALTLSDRCPSCETIQSTCNQTWVCATCNSAKGKMGLYEFFHARMPDQRKFYDFLPALVERKYLKTAYECLDCAKRLDKGDVDGDGKLTVFDIDCALHLQDRRK